MVVTCRVRSRGSRLVRDSASVCTGHLNMRRRCFSWVWGQTPQGLTILSCPHRDMSTMKTDDPKNTMPLMHAIISDSLVYESSRLTIFTRDRNEVYPNGFPAGGHIIMNRCNANPAANRLPNGEVKNPIYQILTGSYSCSAYTTSIKHSRINFVESPCITFNLIRHPYSTSKSLFL